MTSPQVFRRTFCSISRVVDRPQRLEMNQNRSACVSQVMQPHRRNSRMFVWLVAFVAVLLLLFAIVARSAPADSSGDLVLVGGKVYPTPQAAPIPNAVVLIHDGKIAAVARRDDIEIPKSAYIIECAGRVITAGFWNSHVHFTEDAWHGAATAAAARLEEHMQTMLTKWGFTTVLISAQTRRTRLHCANALRVETWPALRSIQLLGRSFPRTAFRFTYPKTWRNS